MKFIKVFVSVASACQNSGKNKQLKQAIQEKDYETTIEYGKNLWSQLNKLVVQGDDEGVIRLCYEMTLSSDIDSCIKTAAAGQEMGIGSSFDLIDNFDQT